MNALGTAHPAIIEAVTAQLGQLGHVSNLFMAEPTIELAERLLTLDPGPGGCSSATPARRPTRPRSRSAG